MNSATAIASEAQPHGLHIIGIGRTGAAYVEALLRTGEVEDALAVPGASFAALLIDIGEDDMSVPNDYARSLKSRLISRNFPVGQFRYESIALELPDVAGFVKELDSVRAPFSAANDHDLITKLPKDFQMPKPGEHTPRAIAKALGAIKTFVGDKPLDAALTRFATQVSKAQHPSTVFVVFGLAGGTGSGMAADVARALKDKLPPSTKIVGVGQLSHSGDGPYHNNLAQTVAIEEIEQALGEGPTKNPFPGGFFVVSPEHSWQRLTAYTATGVKEVRQRFKQMVTNRFVADSFARWAVASNSAHLVRVLGNGGNRFVLFDVAKLTHPGVQVLPGESAATWDAVLQQWISFTPKFSGLRDGFKTDNAEVHVYAARDMKPELIEANMKDVIASTYMRDGNLPTFSTEFFDALTAYSNVIIGGVTKEDLAPYKDAKTALGNVDSTAKLLETA